MVTFFVLGFLVVVLLISDASHLLGVAVLDKEWILRLEEDIFRKLFGILALVLLLEVNESLLGVRNYLDLGHFSLARS